MTDLTKIQGITGILRIVTLILGILVLGLTSGGLYEVFAEIFFLAISVIVFFMSVVILVLFICEVLQINSYTQTLDSAYHGLAGLFLLLGSILFMALVFGTGDLCAHYNRRDDKDCPFRSYAVRILAALLGLINSIVYLITSLFLYKITESI